MLIFFSGKRKCSFDSHAKTKRSKQNPAPSQEARHHEQKLTSDEQNRPSTSDSQYTKSDNKITRQSRKKRGKNCRTCGSTERAPHPPTSSATKRQRALQINERYVSHSSQFSRYGYTTLFILT